MGMTGFVKWTKINDGGSGMWLMYYDPYTGCIMVRKTSIIKSQVLFLAFMFYCMLINDIIIISFPQYIDS